MKKKLLLSLSLALPLSFFAQQLQSAAPTGTPGIANQSTTVSPSDLQSAGTISATQISVAPIGTLPIQSAGSTGHTCKAYDLTQQHYEDRGIKDAFNQSALAGAESMSTGSWTPKTSGVNEIAVIFHVVHNTNNPAENVSNALIMQVYDDLVEDYLLLNANAVNARTGAPYNFVPSNSNINYCLATRDEFGTPLLEVGVTRVATSEEWYDSDNGEENKMKAAATGGSQIWDRNQYLNIWICDISNGAGSGTAGYAYRPSPTFLPSAAIDGIVLDYNLGMNNENVLTHEVGHYLGLDHTWGGSGGCGADDGFADTPFTAGPSFDYPGSCSGSQQNCPGIETQYENYMDYANCTVMFTLEQSAYMLSILQGIRSSLLLSPGCDPVDAPPVVDFTADIPDPIIIPVGGSVNFTSLATNSPTSWTWDFSGGSPNQTVENPSTTWNTIGLYTVTHTATNPFGTGNATKVDHVQVVPAATGIACDTLRNYDPTAPLYIVTGGTGYIEGNLNVFGEDALSWAEPYTAPLSTEVRRIEFVPSAVNDAGGSITFTVWAAGVTPGAVLATEVVPLANLTQFQVNQVDFTTPATVTGNFWVGYTLSYAATDTFALLATLPATNFSYADFAIGGWTDISTIYAQDYAFVMDVLTSNGPAPVANFTFSEQEICAGGQITVNGSSSTNTTDYQWFVTDDPFTTIYEIQNGAGQTFTHPVPGNEAIYLFADGSCMTSAVVLPIAIYPPVTFTTTITQTSCGNNNGVITVTGEAGGTGAVPVYTYSIDGINYQASNVFSNLAAGTYTIYVTTDGSNCEGTLTVTVNASVPFVATVSANQDYCLGGSATITASGGVAYQWFDGATLIASTASTTVSPTVTTQYTCIVTDGAGCQSIVYTTITVNQPPAAPTITAGGPTTFCIGGSVDLTSSEATGNVWSTTDVTQTITATTAGSYTVTYTDPSGCSVTSLPTVVTVNALPAAPVITAGGPTTVCDGGTVDLTSSYGTGNVWSTTEVTATITVGTTGSYTVTHTDGNGCSQISSPISITVEAPYVIALGTVVDPTICAGTDGTIQITGTGTGTVSWTGTATGNSGVITLPYTITGLGAGAYTIDFSSAGGCTSNTLNPTLVDPSAPVIALGTVIDPTICLATDGTIQITGTGTGTVNWTGTAAGTSGAITLPYTITGLGAGPYTIDFTSTSGCTSNTLNPTLVEPAVPVIAIGTVTNPTICLASDGTIQITGTGTGTVNWTGTATGTSGAVTLPYTITGLAAGTYNIDFTVGGCTSTVSVQALTDPAAPTIAVGTVVDPTTCLGTDGTIQITGTGTGTVNWTGAAAGTSGAITLPYTITGLAAGTYNIDFTVGAGCVSNTVVQALVDPAPPTIAAGTVVDPTTCLGTDGTIQITGTGTGTVNWTGTATGTSGVVTLPYTLTGLAAGTYNIDFTVGAGCTSNMVVQVLVDPAPPLIAIGTVVNPTLCLAADGTIEITGTGSGTINWTGAATGTSGAITLPFTVTGLAAGTYTFDFTSTGGCASNTLNQTLVDPSAPVIALGTVTDPTTCLGTDGTIQITGTGSGTVNWTGTATGTSGVVTLPYTITGLAAGTYNIDFTVGAGCISNTVLQVLSDPTPPSAPTITASGAIALCTGGSVDLTSSYGTGNVWSTTDITPTITVTTAGSYTVTHTDANGCSATSIPTTITVSPLPPVPTITAGGPTTVCGGTVDLTSSQPSGIVWSTTQIAATITVATSGSYTVTYTDGSGCSSTSLPTVVTINPLPVIAVGTVVDPAACGTATGTIEVTGTGTGNVSWTGTATGNAAGVPLPYTITGLAVGSYDITFVDGNGCTSNTFTQAIVDGAAPPAPVITSSGPVTFCTGGSVDLTSSYGTNNVWSTTDVTPTITVTTSGSYTVTYTDGFGCSSISAPIAVVVNTAPVAPTVTPSGTTTFCAGGSVDLVSSQPTGNSWSTTEVTQVITVTTTGTYDVTYTDGNGCSTISTPVIVTVNAIPAPPTITPSGSTALCTGGTVDLTSSEPTGNTWSTAEITPTITVSTTGTYDVTYIDGNGCTSTSAPISVTINTNPTAPTITASGSTTLCTGQTVDLTSSEAIGNVWSTTEVTATISVGATGLYTVTYTDPNGCSAVSAPISVFGDNQPTVYAGPDQTVCEGESVTLTGAGAVTYVWDNSVVDNIPFNPAVGSILYSVTGIDGNGCTNTSSVTVTVSATPTPTLTTDISTCVGYGTSTLVGLPAGGIYLGSNVSADQFNPTSAGVGTHTIFYEFTNAAGCIGTTSTTILVEACASLEDLDGTNEVKVYPNPMQHILNVELAGDFSITMHDSRGRIVYQDAGTDLITIDTGLYEMGVYMITISSDTVNTMMRVIKQ